MKNVTKNFLIGSGTGILNGLFGSGGGTLLVPLMEKFLNIKAHKAHATAISVILPITILSIAFYIPGVDVSWKIVLWLLPGGIAGGYLGAKLLNHISGLWLHRIFGAFMLSAAIRFIL